jgi:hypothetical protein
MFARARDRGPRRAHLEYCSRSGQTGGTDPARIDSETGGSSVSRTSRIVAIAAAATTVASLAFATTAGAGQSPTRQHGVLHARYDWTPPRTAQQNGTLQKASRLAGVPLFTRSINDGGTNFQYTIVGKDPFVAQATASTTIKTVLVPLRIHFVDGNTWDPSASDNCDSATALARTQKSPVFVAQKWRANNAPLGTAQYVDAVQREQWYTQTKAGALNPGYHVKLALTTMPKVTVNVPAVDSTYEGTTGCGNGLLPGIDISWFDGYVQHTLIPSIANSTKVFPLFLVENVVWYDTVPSNCCILGYHNAFTLGGKFQSYGVANYDNSGAFSGSADVSALTHEVSEWMNDPNTANPTKPWGHIGQVSGCQSNLETGDPLSGSVIQDNINGKTYHLQELAFFSWFYHQKPSLGANGWYSSGGSFRTPAKPCS